MMVVSSDVFEIGTVLQPAGSLNPSAPCHYGSDFNSRQVIGEFWNNCKVYAVYAICRLTSPENRLPPLRPCKSAKSGSGLPESASPGTCSTAGRRGCCRGLPSSSSSPFGGQPCPGRPRGDCPSP